MSSSRILNRRHHIKDQSRRSDSFCDFLDFGIKHSFYVRLAGKRTLGTVSLYVFFLARHFLLRMSKNFLPCYSSSFITLIIPPLY